MFSKATLLTVAFAGLASSAPLIQKRAHQGTATFYAVGLGNCGGYNSPGDMVVALNTAMYGSTSQKSGYCGQTVHITNEKTGISQDATIVDSCPSCGGAGDLDMSTGLFSALGGTQDEGVFPISWTIGSGGSSSSSSSNNHNNNSNNNSNNSSNNNDSNTNNNSSNNNSNSNNNSGSNDSDNHSSSSSKSAPSKTSSSESAPSPTATKSSNPTDSGVVPTGVSPNVTDSGPVSWWADIDSSYCGFTPAKNETVAVISPSNNYNGTDLSNACGKYIMIFNDDNGKNVTARVASWNPAGERGSLALTDGYKNLTSMNGAMPVPIDNKVRWGFVDFGSNSTKF